MTSQILATVMGIYHGGTGRNSKGQKQEAE